MRLFLIPLVALLALAAGCANTRPGSPEIAPSRQAQLTDPNAGWSVPPGQKTVQDPVPAGAAAQAVQEPRDEAALAAAEKAKRDEAARRAREEMGLQQQPARQTATPAAAPSRAQAVVAPIVPAFPVRVQEERVISLQTVHFGFDTWELAPEARALLDANAQWMKANPEVRVQVGGHADERGTPEYNLALGERRAKRVREYLIEHGVPADNLVTVSYGEEMPLNAGPGEAAWSQNRRAEFSRAEARQVSGR